MEIKVFKDFNMMQGAFHHTVGSRIAVFLDDPLFQ
ncbi:Uncharacterised protein [Mycobacteroides abscessus subsp. abscessus]|nr:Uncharacterised protein [Mycobacteroides abscessus subsp. abscessus]